VIVEEPRTIPGKPRRLAGEAEKVCTTAQALREGKRRPKVESTPRWCKLMRRFEKHSGLKAELPGS
jgi:hypothetical protein